MLYHHLLVRLAVGGLGRHKRCNSAEATISLSSSDSINLPSRIFCENKESHQRGSHQLGNKLKQIINHFETLDFIRLNFNDNHVSYLFLGQT